MKVNYTIALSLIIAVSSCTTDKKADTDTLSESKTEINNSNLSHYQTNLEVAEAEISNYQLGLDLLPEDFSWDPETNEISYKPKTITDQTIINALNKMPHKEEHVFSNPNSLTRSYFIHRQDIEAMVDTISGYENQVNGIRIYIASEAQSLHTSHVFIGPAFGDTIEHVYRDYYLDDNHTRFLYDLTTPCPNSCDNSDELQGLTK